MSAVERVAVVGAGSIGLAAAVDLSQRGHAVDAIVEDDLDRVGALRRAGRLTLTGHLGGAHLHDPPIAASYEGVPTADIVIVATTADRHVDVARALAGVARRDQVVLLATGYAGGASRFAAELRRQGMTERIAVLALNTSPYLSYAGGDGAVHVAAVKSWMEVSADAPATAAAHAPRIAALFPGCVPAPDQLASSLNNPNPIAHVPAYLLNATRAQDEAAGRVAPGGAFHLSDAGSPELESLRSRMDSERMEVMNAIGMGHRALSRGDFGALAYGPGSREDAPPRIGPTFQRRFVREDVPFGLVPLETLARGAGLRVPVISAVIETVCAMTGDDLRSGAPDASDLVAA